MFRKSMESLNKDKTMMIISNAICNEVMQEAMKLAIDNTLREMVKCKEITEMNNLAYKKEKQEKLFIVSGKNIGRNKFIDNEDVAELVNCLIAYKEVLVSDIKKANNIDDLCDKMHYCNYVLKQLVSEDKNTIELEKAEC